MDAVVFFSWIVLAVVVGVAAGSRGRSGVAWGLLSLVLSPLLAGLLLVAIGRPGPNANTHKKCPACAEWCANEAKVCKHCGNSFEKPYQFTADTTKRTISTGDFQG